MSRGGLEEETPVFGGGVEGEGFLARGAGEEEGGFVDFFEGFGGLGVG